MVNSQRGSWEPQLIVHKAAALSGRGIQLNIVGLVPDEIGNGLSHGLEPFLEGLFINAPDIFDQLLKERFACPLLGKEPTCEQLVIMSSDQLLCLLIQDGREFGCCAARFSVTI